MRPARHAMVCAGAALLSAGGLALSHVARAQGAQKERGAPQRLARASTRSIELQADVGYTQGFGAIAPSRPLPSVAGPGGHLGVDFGYRFTPAWSLGVQGEYDEYASALDTAARSVACNAGVTVRAAPTSRGDPWLRLASGYRGLWTVHPPGQPTTYTQGWEVAKATVGYDIRLSAGFALVPQVGWDLNLFVSQVQNGIGTAMGLPALGVFVFAGLGGRFDLSAPGDTAFIPSASTR